MGQLTNLSALFTKRYSQICRLVRTIFPITQAQYPLSHFFEDPKHVSQGPVSQMVTKDVGEQLAPISTFAWKRC